MESSWSESLTLDLIRDISLYKCLWDPTDLNKKNNLKKLECYTSLADKYNSTPNFIKRKWFNLLQTFRNLRRKMKSSDDYKPVWFAFDYINEFMKDIYTPRVEHFDSQSKDDNDYKEDDSDEENLLEIPEKINTSSEKKSLPVSDHEHPSTSNRSLNQQRSSTNMHETVKRRFRSDDNFVYMFQKRKRMQNELISDDECKIFSKLVEIKLKKLNEHTRQIVMNEINQLFFRVFSETSSNNHEEFLMNSALSPRESVSFLTPESSLISNLKQSPTYSLSDESRDPISTNF